VKLMFSKSDDLYITGQNVVQDESNTFCLSPTFRGVVLAPEWNPSHTDCCSVTEFVRRESVMNVLGEG
jgi:hypothetical protein